MAHAMLLFQKYFYLPRTPCLSRNIFGIFAKISNIACVAFSAVKRDTVTRQSWTKWLPVLIVTVWVWVLVCECSESWMWQGQAYTVKSVPVFLMDSSSRSVATVFHWIAQRHKTDTLRQSREYKVLYACICIWPELRVYVYVLGYNCVWESTNLSHPLKS